VEVHQPQCTTTAQCALCNSKKGKFSHTRYRALGPVLIPVYRKSARGDLKQSTRW